MAQAKKKPAKPKSTKRKPVPKAESDGEFLPTFVKLLKSRKITVPRGLAQAPPKAYADQSSSLVEQLAALPDADLKRFAEKVAGWSKRQEERAKAAWESSPLIAELRKRKLKEPTRPVRAVGASVSLSKPLSEWSDKELVRAATEWSRMGSA